MTQLVKRWQWCVKQCLLICLFLRLLLQFLREDLPLHKSLVIHHHQQQWTLHVSHKFSSICLLVYLLRYTMTQKKRVTGVVIVYQQLSYHYVRGHKCVGLQYVVSFMAYSSIVIAAQLWKTCQATKAVIFSSLWGLWIMCRAKATIWKICGFDKSFDVAFFRSWPP